MRGNEAAKKRSEHTKQAKGATGILKGDRFVCQLKEKHICVEERIDEKRLGVGTGRRRMEECDGYKRQGQRI
jgi:hypothetical protein